MIQLQPKSRQKWIVQVADGLVPSADQWRKMVLQGVLRSSVVLDVGTGVDSVSAERVARAPQGYVATGEPSRLVPRTDAAPVFYLVSFDYSGEGTGIPVPRWDIGSVFTAYDPREANASTVGTLPAELLPQKETVIDAVADAVKTTANMAPWLIAAGVIIAGLVAGSRYLPQGPGKKGRK